VEVNVCISYIVYLFILAIGINYSFPISLKILNLVLVLLVRECFFLLKSKVLWEGLDQNKHT